VIKNAIVLALLRMRMSAEEIVTNHCAGKKRADLILAACAPGFQISSDPADPDLAHAFTASRSPGVGADTPEKFQARHSSSMRLINGVDCDLSSLLVKIYSC